MKVYLISFAKHLSHLIYLYLIFGVFFYIDNTFLAMFNIIILSIVFGAVWIYYDEKLDSTKAQRALFKLQELRVIIDAMKADIEDKLQKLQKLKEETSKLRVVESIKK